MEIARSIRSSPPGLAVVPRAGSPDCSWRLCFSGPIPEPFAIVSWLRRSLPKIAARSRHQNQISTARLEDSGQALLRGDFGCQLQFTRNRAEAQNLAERSGRPRLTDAGSEAARLGDTLLWLRHPLPARNQVLRHSAATALVGPHHLFWPAPDRALHGARQ